MSVQIGLDLKRYVLIASDTRVVFFGKDTTEIIGRRDDVPKMVDSPMGIIAGTGYVPLLDAVKAECCARQPATLDELQALMARERARFAAVIPRGCLSLLDYTGWLFTCRAAAGADVATARLVAIYPDVKEVAPEWGTFNCLPVCDGEDEMCNLLTDVIAAKLTAARGFESLTMEVGYNCEVLRSTIAALAEHNDLIGPHCQIGLHFADDRRVVTDIIHADDAVDWSRYARG